MIIIDTNVLLAFLLTDGITRRIIAENPDVFTSPEHCFEELWEHRDRWNKKKLQDSELLEIVNDVKRLFVMAVSPDAYNPYIPEAEAQNISGRGYSGSASGFFQQEML